jgi:hypothetical protein
MAETSLCQVDNLLIQEETRGLLRLETIKHPNQCRNERCWDSQQGKSVFNRREQPQMMSKEERRDIKMETPLWAVVWHLRYRGTPTMADHQSELP